MVIKPTQAVGMCRYSVVGGSCAKYIYQKDVV